MTQQTSPSSTPSGMPGCNPSHLGKYPAPHFPTMTAFVNAITPGSVGYSADLWAVGQRLTNASEPSGGYRVWNGTDALTFVSTSFKSVQVGSNSSVVTSTSGTPTGGNPGDVAINYDAAIYWTNNNGTWINSGSILPATSVVTLTGATTLYADLHGALAGIALVYNGPSANVTIASDAQAAAANHLPWTVGNSISLPTLDASVGVPTIVTPDGKSITGSTSKTIGADCKGSNAWNVGTTDAAAATSTIAGATDAASVNLPTLNTPTATALAAKADLVAGKVPASQLPTTTFTGLTYDGNGRLVSYSTAAGSRTVTYPDSTHIVDSGTSQTVTYTLDNAGRFLSKAVA